MKPIETKDKSRRMMTTCRVVELTYPMVLSAVKLKTVAFHTDFID